jgi:type I site-specific restriction endonuclease
MQLNFPNYIFKIQKRANESYIFDEFRKKYIKLTPEEWVRQHSLCYLVHEKKVLSSYLAVEKQIEINKQIFRFDALVYDKNAKPLVLLECKAPHIKINQTTADQIFTYNTLIQAPYIFITNGLVHLFYSFQSEQRNIIPLSDLPDFTKYY